MQDSKTIRIRRRPSFVLHVAGAPGLRFAFQHRSHSSHSSHSSHASHASHASHYSREYGGLRTTPGPTVAPTPQPAPVPTPVPRKIVEAQPAPAIAAPNTTTTITVQRINKSMRTITGKTSTNQVVLFNYRDNTQIEEHQTLRKLEEIPGGHPPLRPGDRVTVVWHTSGQHGRLATRIIR